jgi:hypothetical protein
VPDSKGDEQAQTKSNNDSFAFGGFGDILTAPSAAAPSPSPSPSPLSSPPEPAPSTGGFSFIKPAKAASAFGSIAKKAEDSAASVQDKEATSSGAKPVAAASSAFGASSFGKPAASPAFGASAFGKPTTFGTASVGTPSLKEPALSSGGFGAFASPSGPSGGGFAGFAASKPASLAGSPALTPPGNKTSIFDEVSTPNPPAASRASQGENQNKPPAKPDEGASPKKATSPEEVALPAPEGSAAGGNEATELITPESSPARTPQPTSPEIVEQDEGDENESVVDDYQEETVSESVSTGTFAPISFA